MTVEPLELGARSEWRAWLEANHATAREAWVCYAKKGSGLVLVEYEESVLEALCFGWVDGLVRTVDEGRYACRFTPRRPGSRWSESNRRRAALLLAEGLMAPAGLAALPPDLGDR